MIFDLEYIRKNNLIIFDVIYGSNAYGTNRPDSDIDKRGVYVMPDSLLFSIESVEGYKDSEYYSEITDGTQNVVYYELRKFLYMISNSRPNALEILNIPDDCIIYKHPVMDLILKEKDKFITKKCQYTFPDYIEKQLRKAQGLNKKQNWEKDRFTRKTPLEFCYAIIENQSKDLKSYLDTLKLDLKFCGITKIPHARDMYALYYDESAALCFSELIEEGTRLQYKSLLKSENTEMGKGYKGIIMDTSNDIRLSSIPKGEKCLFHVYYNKDGYSMHCKDYKEYQEYLLERNTSRYTDFESHGQGLDGKNMLHCRRIFEMCEEMADGKGINVRRKNAAELLKIRQGEVSLRDLIDYVNDKLPSIRQKFQESDLPDSIDINLLNSLLRKVRSLFNQIE